MQSELSKTLEVFLQISPIVLERGINCRTQNLMPIADAMPKKSWNGWTRSSSLSQGPWFPSL